MSSKKIFKVMKSILGKWRDPLPSKTDFTLTYLIGLGIIALLTIILQFVIQVNLQILKEGQETGQVMRNYLLQVELSRNSFLQLQLQLSKRKFLGDLNKFDENFKRVSEQYFSYRLNKSDDLFGPPQYGTKSLNDIRKSYDELKQILIDMQASLKSSKTRGDILAQNSSLVSRFFELQDDYLATLSGEFDQYTQYLQQRHDYFRLLEFSIFVLTLIVLVLEIFYIFRPANQKLKQALQARSEFFGKIGHEILNPMNSILGMVQLLEESELNDFQRLYLSKLKYSAKGLLDFLNNVIGYARRDKGEISVNLDTVDLQVPLDEVITIFSLELFNKKLKLYLYLDSEVGQFVKSDQIKIRHILLNLIGNAIKYTDQGYIKLRLSIEERANGDSFLVFTVQDTGPGIPPDLQEKIFEGFVQAGPPLGHKGHGLGLAIVSDYVKLLSGEVRVESDGKNGSTFYCKIPYEMIGQEKISSKIKEQDFFDRIIVIGSDQLYNWIRHTQPRFKGIISQHLSFDENEILSNIKSGNKFLIFDEVNCDGNVYVRLLENVNAQFSLIFFSVGQESFNQICHNVTVRYEFPAVPWRVLSPPDFVKTLPRVYKKNNVQKNKFRFLVCDDSPDNRLFLCSILKRLSDSIDQAENGCECLGKIQNVKYDAIFLDIQMPVLDGFSTVKKIRAQERHGHVLPVIAVTAHSSPDEVKLMRQSGFTDYIRKPFSISDVLTSLDKLGINLDSSKETSDSKSFDSKSFNLEIKEKLLKHKTVFIKNKLLEIDQVLATNSRPIDLEKVRFIGHNLKGNAKIFGLDGLSGPGAHLEKCALDKDLDQCIVIMKQLRSGLNELLKQ